MTQLGNRIIENFTLAPNLELFLPNSPTVPALQNNHISRWNASNIAKEQSFSEFISNHQFGSNQYGSCSFNSRLDSRVGAIFILMYSKARQ
jgi:hypothetical protein